MLTILKSLVQPTLDYCYLLWSPGDQATINKLECVQRHLVNRIKDRALTGVLRQTLEGTNPRETNPREDKG